jgi:hypothetical protein
MSKQTDLINIPDAITVDGTGILNLDSTFSSGTTGGIIRLKDAGTQFGDFNEDSGNFIISSAQVDKDIIFKGNDGGAIITAMTIDMSAGGNVGIGTSSPSTQLEVKGSTYSLIRVNGGNTNNAGIDFGDTDDVDIGRIRYDNSSDAMQFWTNNAERMRIDSSGNVLVGTTNNSPATNNVAGSSHGSLGNIQASVDGNPCLFVNRKSNDGNIISLRKDGTTVGSIGVNGGRPYLTNPTYGGLRVDDYRVNPATTSGANWDNALDLGSGGTRWKDLYLSGGVYLGGTGSANKLDDYEKGAWTPADGSGAGLTLTINSASYVKVGRLVMITFDISYPSTSNTNGSSISGLPFVVASDGAGSISTGYDTTSGVNDANKWWIGGGSSSFYSYGKTNANFSGGRMISSGAYFTS